jgi:hypothetical protein
MSTRHKLDYEKERVIITRKYAFLRSAVIRDSDGLDFLSQMEAIAMQCLDRRLPKKVIGCIHSEMRVWIRDGLFGVDSKDQYLAKLASIDEERDKNHRA